MDRPRITFATRDDGKRPNNRNQKTSMSNDARSIPEKIQPEMWKENIVSVRMMGHMTTFHGWSHHVITYSQYEDEQQSLPLCSHWEFDINWSSFQVWNSPSKSWGISSFFNLSNHSNMVFILKLKMSFLSIWAPNPLNLNVFLNTAYCPRAHSYMDFSHAYYWWISLPLTIGSIRNVQLLTVYLSMWILIVGTGKDA